MSENTRSAAAKEGCTRKTNLPASAHAGCSIISVVNKPQLNYCVGLQ